MTTAKFNTQPFHCQCLGQVVHTHVPLSPSILFGTSRGAAMSCNWEGNCRSGVALAMRHKLQWFIHLWAQGLCKGDEPTLLMGYGTLYLLLQSETFYNLGSPVVDEEWMRQWVIFLGWTECSEFPSMLQWCWLDGRKGVWPVKYLCYLSPKLLFWCR